VFGRQGLVMSTEVETSARQVASLDVSTALDMTRPFVILNEVKNL
jgi:hypothetical protein